MTTRPTRTRAFGVGSILFVFPSCSVSGARHAVISQALGEQGDGTILTPGPTAPIQIKDVPQPGALNPSKTKQPDLSKHVLRPLSGRCSYYQSGRTPWCPHRPGIHCRAKPAIGAPLINHTWCVKRWNINLLGAVIVLNMILSGLQFLFLSMPISV